MSVNLQNKKKLGIGIAAVAAAAITLGAGTYAFFSSTGTADNASGTAGSLQLNEPFTHTANLGTFVPGGNSSKRVLTYENAGSINGTLTFDIAVQDAEDGCIGDEQSAGDNTCSSGPGGELSQKLKVRVLKDGVEIYDNLVSVLRGSDVLDRAVSSGQKVDYTFDYYLPDSRNKSDNIVQGDSLTVTTTATLKQPNS